MLTAENLLSFSGKAHCTATSSKIRTAYTRFYVSKDSLRVDIAGKGRPVFYKDGNPNIFLDFNSSENKNEVTVNYGPGFGSTTFFVGDKESEIVDSILVWLIDTENAFLYSSHKRCETDCVIKCICGFHVKIDHKFIP